MSTDRTEKYDTLYLTQRIEKEQRRNKLVALGSLALMAIGAVYVLFIIEPPPPPPSYETLLAVPVDMSLPSPLLETVTYERPSPLLPLGAERQMASVDKKAKRKHSRH